MYRISDIRRPFDCFRAQNVYPRLSVILSVTCAYMFDALIKRFGARIEININIIARGTVRDTAEKCCLLEPEDHEKSKSQDISLKTNPAGKKYKQI